MFAFVSQCYDIGRKQTDRVWFKRQGAFFVPIFQVIYQTRETVFHLDIQTPRRELKIRRAAEYF